jgi:predicted RNA-binding protein (virulence factor B family)
MAYEELLGRTVSLTVRRLGPPGAFLVSDEREFERHAETVLLPGAEVPEGLAEGDELKVFVHLDSEQRPLATLRTPRLELGEVAFLKVTACTSVGAFADWGLPKELLVPFAEQTRELRVGDVHPFGLYLDNSSRLAATMRVSEMLGPPRRRFALDEWVMGEAWRWDPSIGLFVIIERTSVGLVPASEPQALARGEAARFRVAHVFPDGKVELSLRAFASQEIDGDAERITEVLAQARAPRCGDHSSPEEIRQLFGLSKKAFKRAMGRLFKEGVVVRDAEGCFRLSANTKSERANTINTTPDAPGSSARVSNAPAGRRG